VGNENEWNSKDKERRPVNWIAKKKIPKEQSFKIEDVESGEE